MELLDRYLNFVRLWLPRGKQQDIIDELSEDLHAQIADKETELGRPLEDSELEALLKQCGHPLLVAGRYQSQQQLIGQPFFPLYMLGLKVVQWVLLPLMLVVGAFLALFRTQPFMSCFYIVGVLTVTFIVLERLQVKLHFLGDWKPSELPKLPVIPDPVQIPRSASFGGFIGLLVFVLWWVGLIRFPELPHVHFMQVLPEGFFWPVLLLTAAEMGLHLVNLFLPWWTRKRAAFRLALDLATLMLIAALTTTWPWFGVRVDASVQPDLVPVPHDVAVLEQVVNLSLLISLGIMALSYVPRVMQDLRRARGLPPFSNPLLKLFLA
jgi:hypothetical protein